MALADRSPSWGDVFAHGIGGSKDLPIPLELTIAGAVAALTVSFTVLAVAWRTPRYDDDDRTGRPAPAWLARIVDSRPWFVVLAGVRHAGLRLHRDGRGRAARTA